jgi:hypothetical protein
MALPAPAKAMADLSRRWKIFSFRAIFLTVESHIRFQISAI